MWPSSVDAGKGRARRQGHTRDQPRQRHETAAIQRQVQDGAIVYELPYPTALRLQQRRVAAHRDFLTRVSHTEIRVHSYGLTRHQDEIAALETLESAGFKEYGVAAGLEMRESVCARRIARSSLGLLSVQGGRADPRSVNSGSTRVADHAGHLGAPRLPVSQTGGIDDQEGRERQPGSRNWRNEVTHSLSMPGPTMQVNIGRIFNTV